MDKDKFPRLLAAVVTVGILFVEAGGRLVKAQVDSPTFRAAAEETPTDDFGRSYRINTYTLMATSGAARGENIYFYKCWMCHNKYTKSAPSLKSLFARSILASGKPVNDDSRADQRW